MEKPRIIIFIGSLRAGGKERRLIELLSYLKIKNHFKILLVLTKNEIHYSQFYNLDIEYKIIKKRFRKNDLTVFWQFYQLCKSYQPDLVHTWGRMQTFYSIPAVLFQDFKLINSQITGAPLRKGKPGMGRLIDLVNFRFSNIILANSKSGFDAYGPPPRKRRLIMNGVNLSRFENLTPVDVVKRKYGLDTPFIVVMLASFTPAKDYKLFLQVALNVTAQRDDITFIGVGGHDGDDSEYKRMCEASVTHPRIKFQTEIQDAESLVNACSIGVLFSTNGEGTSNAILEYMALGKPVIATNSGGTTELIRSGENGYLVKCEAVDETSKLIVGLVDDPQKARLFGARSRKRIIEDFSIDTMGNEFETVYRQVMSEGKTNTKIQQALIIK